MRDAGGRFPESAETLRSEVRAFVADRSSRGSFTPVVDSWVRGVDPEFSADLGARGWIGMTWPLEYGGQARSYLDRFVVLEELLIAGAPVGAHWFADRQIGPSLLRFGTERQRREFLPRIAAGTCFFAIGLSEPDTGSDLASVRTRATRVNGGWRVTGTKIWTSTAHLSHYMMTLVRTAPGRHDGLSQLIIDLASPGVTIRPIALLTGERHFNEVRLDDVFVPDHMVFGQIGQGWDQVNGELAYERSGPERYLSTMQLILEFAEHAKRQQDTRCSAALGSLFAQLHSVRDLSVRVALALDKGAPQDDNAALVKDLGTRFEQESVELVRTALGSPEPGSRLEDLLWQAVYSAPTFTLRGGTNEVLRVLVSRGLGPMSPRDADPVIDNLTRLLRDEDHKPAPLRTALSTNPTWKSLERSGYLAIDGPDGDFRTACRVLQACAHSPATAGLPIGNALLVLPWLRRAVEFSDDVATIAVAVDSTVTVTSMADHVVLTGSARVNWAWPDAALIVRGRGADGEHLLLEIPNRPISGLSYLDSVTRGGIPTTRLHCEGAALPRSSVRRITAAQLRALRSRNALAVTLQIAGALERITAMTVSYAGVRTQFGKTIDQFQMVKSHLAALAAEASVTSAAASSAAELLDDEEPADVAHTAVLAARVRAAQAVTAATRLAHQVHGTIGVTEEHPLHLLTTQLWALRDLDMSESKAQVELGRQLAAGGADFLRRALVNESERSGG